MEPWMLAGLGKALGLLLIVGLLAVFRKMDRFLDPPPRTNGTLRNNETPSKPES